MYFAASYYVLGINITYKVGTSYLHNIRNRNAKKETPKN